MASHRRFGQQTHLSAVTASSRATLAFRFSSSSSLRLARYGLSTGRLIHGDLISVRLTKAVRTMVSRVLTGWTVISTCVLGEPIGVRGSGLKRRLMRIANDAKSKNPISISPLIPRASESRLHLSCLDSVTAAR